MEDLQEKKKKNNIEKAIDVFSGLDKGKIPPNKVDKDSEGRKEKRGDFRKLKHKKRACED